MPIATINASSVAVIAQRAIETGVSMGVKMAIEAAQRAAAVEPALLIPAAPPDAVDASPTAVPAIQENGGALESVRNDPAPHQDSVEQPAAEIQAFFTATFEQLEIDLLLKVEAILRAGDGATREQIHKVYGRTFDWRVIHSSLNRRFKRFQESQKNPKREDLVFIHNEDSQIRSRVFIRSAYRHAMANAFASATGRTVPLGPTRALLREDGGGIDLTPHESDPLPLLRKYDPAEIMRRVEASPQFEPSKESPVGRFQPPRAEPQQNPAAPPAPARVEQLTKPVVERKIPSPSLQKLSPLAVPAEAVTQQIRPAYQPDAPRDISPAPAATDPDYREYTLREVAECDIPMGGLQRTTSPSTSGWGVQGTPCSRGLLRGIIEVLRGWVRMKAPTRRPL